MRNLLAVFLLLSLATSAQACSTHSRKLAKPWTLTQALPNAPVLSLLTSSSPSAVSRFITPVVIDTVEGQSIGFWTHVCEEVFEDQPSIANIYSASAVIFPGELISISAPLVHGGPSFVLRGFHPMPGMPVPNPSASPDASTRECVRGEKVVCSEDFNGPTIAQTKPMDDGVMVTLSSTSRPLGSEVSESSSSQIGEPGHITNSTSKCSTHQRKWYKPFVSNMCQQDYDAWLATHHAKPFYKSVQWWAGEAVMVGAITGDAWTTSHRCVGCIEENPILGSNPSAKAVYGLALVNLTAQTTLHWYSYNLGKNDPSASWREISLWAQPVATGTIGGYFTYNNSQTGYQAYMKPVWIHGTGKP